MKPEEEYRSGTVAQIPTSRTFQAMEPAIQELLGQSLDVVQTVPRVW